MTNEEIQARITKIDAILQSGAKSITLDGVTTSFDHDSLRAERAELLRRLSPTTRRRPFALRPRIY